MTPQERKLIDELLDDPAYGEYLATVWRNLIGTSQPTKGGRDNFLPWLAEQFNDNRGWNSIVSDLLTVRGPIRDNPATAFLFANAENFQPQPNKLAASTARCGNDVRRDRIHQH